VRRAWGRSKARSGVALPTRAPTPSPPSKTTEGRLFGNARAEGSGAGAFTSQRLVSQRRSRCVRATPFRKRVLGWVLTAKSEAPSRGAPRISAKSGFVLRRRNRRSVTPSFGRSVHRRNRRSVTPAFGRSGHRRNRRSVTPSKQKTRRVFAAQRRCCAHGGTFWKFPTTRVTSYAPWKALALCGSFLRRRRNRAATRTNAPFTFRKSRRCPHSPFPPPRRSAPSRYVSRARTRRLARTRIAPAIRKTDRDRRRRDAEFFRVDTSSARETRERGDRDARERGLWTRPPRREPYALAVGRDVGRRLATRRLERTFARLDPNPVRRRRVIRFLGQKQTFRLALFLSSGRSPRSTRLTSNPTRKTKRIPARSRRSPRARPPHPGVVASSR